MHITLLKLQIHMTQSIILHPSKTLSEIKVCYEGVLRMLLYPMLITC